MVGSSKCGKCGENSEHRLCASCYLKELEVHDNQFKVAALLMAETLGKEYVCKIIP